MSVLKTAPLAYGITGRSTDGRSSANLLLATGVFGSLRTRKALKKFQRAILGVMTVIAVWAGAISIAQAVIWVARAEAGVTPVQGTGPTVATMRLDVHLAN